MMRSNRRNAYGLGLVALALVAFSSSCSTFQTSSKKESEHIVAPEVIVQAPSTCSLPAPPVMAPYFPPPDQIDLCGEPVPLNIEDVQERFDREFTLVVYNHAQVFLWLKRMERYFPWIEERLRFYGLPEDLKYVAIVESDLQPNVCSPKGAAGPWQFMPSTGSYYGLEQKGSMDKRYDFERATESAFKYLNDLYKRYRSWSLALAVYNCGDKRVTEEMRAQGVKDYYRLKLPLETERYVMRVLAIKAVLSNPTQYGYFLPKGKGYSELKLDCVKVNFPSPMSIQSVASAAGISYREFKRLNPVFRAEVVPTGPQELKFPEGAGTVFEKNFSAGRISSSQPAATVSRPEEDQAEPDAEESPAPRKASAPAAGSVSSPPKSSAQGAASHVKTHEVKKGETLSGIASRYKVSVKEIRQANKLEDDDIAPGQKLRIPAAK